MSDELAPLSRQVELVSRACQALAEARSIGEVKEIRDKAEAMRLYLKQRDEGQEAQNAAAEIKIRAERRAGELLREMPKNGGASVPGTRSHDVTAFPPTLSDLGIHKMESSRWQKIADLPEEDFERHIEDVKARGLDLTTNGVLDRAKERKVEERKNEKRADLEARAREVSPSDRWSIVTGDCLAGLARVEAGSARLVFADPPYNIGVDYGDHHDDALPPGDYVDWCGEWIALAARALTPDGSLWVLINHEWAADVELAIRAAGLAVRDWITWYESFGLNCTGKFNRCSRRLFHAVRDPDDCVFRPEAVTRESDRQSIYGDKRANPAGKLWDDVWGINPPIPRVVGTAAERLPGFPTQLPLRLLTAVVGCASDPDDLVLDPFSGSGTTGEAALRLGRRYLGFEMSEEFARLSRARLAGVTTKEDSDAGEIEACQDA